MKALRKIKTTWSPELAYAVGLITTDGNLSSDGRHISFTSKDKEQIENFLGCLKCDNKITKNVSGSGNLSLRVQIGDIHFYKFLLKVGLTPAKTKTLGKIKIPKKYFFDFLRGHLDGDGTFYSYFDPRWKNSYMFYTIFISASKDHLDWIRKEITRHIGILGHITKAKTSSIYQLKYAKADSLKLLGKIYYNNQVICLSRKREKIALALKKQIK